MKHQWVVFVTYGLTDAEARAVENGEQGRLDAERRLSVDGPACLNCEMPWSERLARNPCSATWHDMKPSDVRVVQA